MVCLVHAIGCVKINICHTSSAVQNGDEVCGLYSGLMA